MNVRLRRLPVALLILAAAAACGTTVAPGAATLSRQSASGLGASGGSTASPGGPPTVGPDGPAGSGAVSAGARLLTTTDTSPASVAASPRLPPVQIGAFSLKNSAAFLAAFAVSKDTVDLQAAQDAILKYINAHGGFGGRRGIAVYHPLDATSTETYAQLAQESCTDFTEDHHVAAVIQAPTEIVPCLHAHHVVALNDADAGGDSTFVDRFGADYYLPGALNWDRMSIAWVQGLAAQGYFGRGGSYGLIYYDQAGMPASVERTLKPALAREGVTLKDTYEVAWPGSNSQAGSTVAAIQSAVLRFRTDGIDHVLIDDINGTMAVFFLREADSQGYAPRYGLTSNSHLVFLLDNAPTSQLDGALAAGWRPFEDVSGQTGFNSSARTCLGIMTRAGIATSDYGLRSSAADLCDQWFFLQAAANRASGLSDSAVQAAVDRFASQWQSARTLATRFGPARTNDGAAAIAPVGYVTSCTCWRARPPIGIAD